MGVSGSQLSRTAVSVLVKAQTPPCPPADNYLKTQSPGLTDTKLTLWRNGLGMAAPATTIQLNFLKYRGGELRFMDFQVFNDHHLGLVIVGW